MLDSPLINIFENAWWLILSGFCSKYRTASKLVFNMLRAFQQILYGRIVRKTDCIRIFNQILDRLRVWVCRQPPPYSVLFFIRIRRRIRRHPRNLHPRSRGTRLSKSTTLIRFCRRAIAHCSGSLCPPYIFPPSKGVTAIWVHHAIVAFRPQCH